MKNILFLAVILGFAASSFAVFSWENGDGSHSWNVPNNWANNTTGSWVYGVLPGLLDDVNLSNTSSGRYVQINAGDDIAVQDVSLGWNIDGSMIIDGGDFQCRNFFLGLGDQETGEVSLIVNGGNFYSVFDGQFGGKIMPYNSDPNSTSRITMNGGLIQLDNALEILDDSAYQAKLAVQLYGGIFDPKFVAVQGGSGSNLSIDIAGGTLLLDTIGNFQDLVGLYDSVSVNGEKLVWDDVVGQIDPDTGEPDPEIPNPEKLIYDLETYPGRVAITASYVVPEAKYDLEADGVLDAKDIVVMAQQWLAGN
ncbi:MAG: hypothetical protein ACIAQZ_15680 [Sedimentisphaeraceae bacterium JB056]